MRTLQSRFILRQHCTYVRDNLLWVRPLCVTHAHMPSVPTRTQPRCCLVALRHACLCVCLCVVVHMLVCSSLCIGGCTCAPVCVLGRRNQRGARTLWLLRPRLTGRSCGACVCVCVCVCVCLCVYVDRARVLSRRVGGGLYAGMQADIWGAPHRLGRTVRTGRARVPPLRSPSHSTEPRALLPTALAETCCAGWRTCTHNARSTATSSRATSCSPPTAPPSWVRGPTHAHAHAHRFCARSAE
jgi:hypothetical protein